MIKRETIKQAIDAIAQRNPEIGYTLDELLGTGVIDAPAPGDDPMLGDDFFFFFDRYKARVSKFLYIQKGTVPIEERLLVKYGELLKKRQLLERGESVETPAAAKTIRTAGLRFMVIHEIDYAIERIRKSEAPDRALISFLQSLKHQEAPLSASPHSDDPTVLYRGVVDRSTPAFFMMFPFSMDNLLQVADINLEFFHVRFFLNRLIRSQLQNCFVCVVDDRIAGIIYLIFREQMFFRNLVIDFVATLRGKAGDPAAASELKGVGTFLVAGVWLEWKSGAIRAKAMTLDSEVAARGFYESMGFEPRGFAEFVLTAPKGYLLKSILTLKGNQRELPPRVIEEIARLMLRNIKYLRKAPKNAREVSARSATLDALKTFLTTDTYGEFAGQTRRLLRKYKKRIPESETLLRSATHDAP